MRYIGCTTELFLRHSENIRPVPVARIPLIVEVMGLWHEFWAKCKATPNVIPGIELAYAFTYV